MSIRHRIHYHLSINETLCLQDIIYFEYCIASADISRTTTDAGVWSSLTPDCFVGMGRTHVKFRARANNDVHLALTKYDSTSSAGTAYYIIIGGWSNTRSTIRFGLGTVECVYTSHTPLSRTYFDEFWISWTGNYVLVGSGSTIGSGTFLSCHHASMYEVNFIFIRTCCSSSGEWRFPNGNKSCSSNFLSKLIRRLEKVNQVGFLLNSNLFTIFTVNRCCL